MKYFFSLIASLCFLVISQPTYAEDRGGHCQPPSCAGARVGKFCGGKWVCSIGHDKFTTVDDKVICLRKGSPPSTKCKDGAEVSAEDTAKEEEE